MHTNFIPRSRVAFPRGTQELSGMAGMRPVRVRLARPRRAWGLGDAQSGSDTRYHPVTTVPEIVWVQPPPNSVAYDYSKSPTTQKDSGPSGIGSYMVGGSYYNEVNRLKNLVAAGQPLAPNESALLGAQLEADKPSKTFQIAKTVALTFIGATAVGAALTGAGVIGAAAAPAAAAPATLPGSLTLAPYAATAASSIAPAAGVLAPAVAAGSSIIPTVGVIAKTAGGALLSAGISQGTGILAGKLADALMPDAPATPIPDAFALPGAKPDFLKANAIPLMIGAALLGFFVLLPDGRKGKRK